MKTDRQKAMEWWNSLSDELTINKETKAKYANIYFETRTHCSLTGREIEHIWNMEVVWKNANPEEEKTYTKEDVEFLILQSHIARNKMNDYYNEIPEWIEKNL